MEYKNLLQDKIVRIEAMRNNFPLFFVYHFWRPEITKFQVDWMKSMQSSNHTFIEWFRASRKTTLVKVFIVWCICYKKRDYILRQSYEESDSRNNVTDIAKMLFAPTIINDYWLLFPKDTKLEEFNKKTQWVFDTTNKVRVQAKWLMQSTRWLNTFDMSQWQTERPSLLILDDVDVNKSVMNPQIINQNEKKILWEVFGALDPLDHKIIFLGNTILEDWIVPRFRRMFKDIPKWDVFHQPLFVDGVNVRPEVFTDEVVADAESAGKIAFWQNYLLIPSTSGTWVFIRDYFDYFLESHFEMVDSPLQKNDIRRGIFIDPAFSTSKKSDDAVIAIVGEHRMSKQYYLLDWYGGTSAPSQTRSKLFSMYHKATMWWYKIEFFHCEDAPINKDQTQFIKDLRDDMMQQQIQVPLYTSIPNKQKTQRITDTLEPVMSLNGIKFNRWLDSLFMQKLERQLLDHPNADHDDHTDCLAQAIWYFRNKPEMQKKDIDYVPISAITRKPILQNKPRYWNPTTSYWKFSGITGRPL